MNATQVSQQLARQQENHAYELARQNKAKQSNGFNLDALGSPEEVAALATTYDQVQVRNGQQSILFQRDTGAAGSTRVSTASVVGANNQLQAVEAFGSQATMLKNQAALSAKLVPFWQKYGVPIGGGAVGLILLVIVLKGKR